MPKVKINGGESSIEVSHCGKTIELNVISFVQGRHTVSHTVIFDDPEDALKLAESIRESAISAKIYQEHNPNE